ncbi:MAG: LysR family transcriptional regulator [Myxococcales bacterium]|nr:LysR family transcriptional regulator [Myxococcales bacterium]MCB9731069.1 LysR family transcriptional regulator [Deltaproteobacteria bacterium]
MTEAYPFNLNHLRYFYEVARAGNMRRAAMLVGISQPALSKQIQALEDSIGLQLFYRSSKGLKPTPDGETVFSHCERVFGHLRDLEEAIELMRSGSAGRVTIGAIYSISTHLLPRYIRQYHELHPKVRFKIVTGRSAQVLQALREHRVDVGFVAGRPEHDDLMAMPVVDNPLVVVVAPGHPIAELAAKGPVGFDVLHRGDMVAFDEEAPTRQVTDDYLVEHEITPRVMAESPSIEAIKQLVREGIGFAVLPRHCIVDEIECERLVEVPIRGWDLRRYLYAVYLAAPDLPPTVKQFVELIPKPTEIGAAKRDAPGAFE